MQVAAQARAVVQFACEMDLQALDARMAANAKVSGAQAQQGAGQPAAPSRRATMVVGEGVGATADSNGSSSSSSSSASFALQAARRSEKRRIACEWGP